MSPADEPSPHRLFAAIVLMGAGLAVGCGGIAEREGEANVPGGPQELAPSPAEPVVPGPAEPVVPGPFACPPQQWTCASQNCDYSAHGWILPEACRCDVTRPLSAKECEPGQVFVCQDVTAASDGRPFTTSVALSCSCRPNGGDICQTDCYAAYQNGYARCQPSEDELSILCGCAVPYLK